MTVLFFFSSIRRHTRWNCDWSSDVCSSDLRDAVQDRLQAVGLLGALLALSAQLRGALLHRGAFLGAEGIGPGRGILRGHSRASFPDAQGLDVRPAFHRRLGPATPRRFSIPDRFGPSEAHE